MEQLIAQSVTSYAVRRETRDGQRYIVVPLVMMVEGVHNGSRGPLLHTEEELGKNVSQWNGVPVTIGHPQVNGEFVSATTPNISHVGTLFNARMDNGKLKANARINEQRLLAESPTAHGYISQGRALDVSVGVYSDEIQVNGDWNGETYIGIASNYRPDHLALLPGEQGACSWADGCGVRVNKDSNHDLNTNLNPNNNEKMKDDIQVLKEAAVARVEIQANALSLSGRVRAISNAVDGMDVRSDNGPYVVHYLEEVYDGYVIYRKTTRPKEGAAVEVLLKHDYQLNADNSVTLSGEPVVVRKETNYVQVTPTNNSINTNTKTSEMSKPSVCLTNKVNAVISKTGFTEEDREYLLTQSEAVLDKMIPETPAAPVVNAEQAAKVLRETYTKPEEFIGVMPETMQANMTAGLKLYNDKRTATIQSILANSKAGWTEEELTVMSCAMLEKIANTAKAPVDYSAAGGQDRAPQNNAASGKSNDILMPTGY